MSFEQQVKNFCSTLSNVTRSVQNAEAKAVERIFKRLLKENEVQINVIKKQAKVRIATAIAKAMEKTKQESHLIANKNLVLQSVVRNWEKKSFGP